MKYLIMALTFTSCVLPKHQRVVEPIEALQMCADTSIKSYSALTGNVKCAE